MGSSEDNQPPALTEDAYRRWLRAHRPDLQTFLSLSDDQQEVLANIGDDYTSHVAVEHAMCAANPKLAEAELIGNKEESDELLLKGVVDEAIARILNAREQNKPAPKTRPSLAGVGKKSPSFSSTGAPNDRTLFGIPMDRNR